MSSQEAGRSISPHSKVSALPSLSSSSSSIIISTSTTSDADCDDVRASLPRHHDATSVVRFVYPSGYLNPSQRHFLHHKTRNHEDQRATTQRDHTTPGQPLVSPRHPSCPRRCRWIRDMGYCCPSLHELPPPSSKARPSAHRRRYQHSGHLQPPPPWNGKRLPPNTTRHQHKSRRGPAAYHSNNPERSR